MDDEAHANPVREVGSMLRMLTEIVRGEREKETGLLEQYVCFRKNKASTLGAAARDVEKRIEGGALDHRQGPGPPGSTSTIIRTMAGSRCFTTGSEPPPPAYVVLVPYAPRSPPSSVHWRGRCLCSRRRAPRASLAARRPRLSRFWYWRVVP